MNVVLAAINAKYSHTSLSVRCLYRALENRCTVQIQEYTINEQINAITGSLYRCGADVVAFSCYIWNIEMVLRICSDLKRVQPEVCILLGGYEVSYDAAAVLRDNPAVDAVLCGEGEQSICEFVEAVSGKRGMAAVAGLSWRDGARICQNPPRQQYPALDALPFVYDESITELRGRIVYYETSRGCPYACGYCLSGAAGNVRFLSLERVKRELQFFIDHEVPLVKLVDRTFNADVRRAREIFRYIIDHAGQTRFHFELAGDLLDDETLMLLENAPPGLMQFEIGIQSTCEETIAAVSRNISFASLSGKIARLLKADNIHIHVDLIAGLPWEDLARFRQSVNEVLALRPHVLQLGFLKLLKGSRLRAEADSYGYRYQQHPPYEVLGNNWLSYADLLELKDVEAVLEWYYNSGQFGRTMDYLFVLGQDDCYAVLREMASYCRGNGLFDRALSQDARYGALAACFRALGTSFLERLAYDYACCHTGGMMPDWSPAQADDGLKQQLHGWIGSADWVASHLPHLAGMHPKQIAKRVHALPLLGKIYVFDGRAGKAIPVTADFAEKTIG